MESGDVSCAARIACDNTKALSLIKQISPAAWRPVPLNGHYTFHANEETIDQDTVTAGLDLG